MWCTHSRGREELYTGSVVRASDFRISLAVKKFAFFRVFRYCFVSKGFGLMDLTLGFCLEMEWWCSDSNFDGLLAFI